MRQKIKQATKVYSHIFFKKFQGNHKECIKKPFIPHPLDILAKQALAKEAIIRVEWKGGNYHYEPSGAYKRKLNKLFK